LARCAIDRMLAPWYPVATNAWIAPASTGSIGRGPNSRQLPARRTDKDGARLRGGGEVFRSSINDAAGTPSATAICCSRWTEIPVFPFSMALIVAGLTPTRSASLRTETSRVTRSRRTASPAFGVAPAGSIITLMEFRISEHQEQVHSGPNL